MTTPAQLVDLAMQHGAPVVASSYNEPLITSEWAVEVFKEAESRGLQCAYISNGNGTPQVLDFIRPYVDAYKVDLKTFDPTALPPARRRDGERHRHHPHAQGARLLGRDRHARRPRLQRRRRTT